MAAAVGAALLALGVGLWLRQRRTVRAVQTTSRCECYEQAAAASANHEQAASARTSTPRENALSRELGTPMSSHPQELPAYGTEPLVLEMVDRF
eukprot:609624-Prymnesium_polylepis.1